MKKSKIDKLKILVFFAGTTVSTMSFAVHERRQEIPAMAGTEIHLENGESCTVGGVFRRRGFWQNITAYRKNTRYAVTARHCVVANEEVRVGLGFNSGQWLGKVVWLDQIRDVAMVRVPPDVTWNHVCVVDPKWNNPCHLTYTTTPRAVGRVITVPFGLPTFSSLPLAGVGSPAPGLPFCTSGAITNITCDWVSAPIPHGPESPPEGVAKGAINTLRPVQPGDSGGAVVSTHRLLYGFISFRQNPLDPNLPYFMGYTPVEYFHQLQPDYSLAPP
ncbi:hypothetical protein [Acidovorax sp. LjRoot117]|uniref:hypothetical protein n=1 Tax=Acidovorax sp. LjRoot117 TaxID=3342255 RepID=UPI003ED14847